jgi:hypothetical protein
MVTFTNLTAANDTVDRTTYTTASISPTGDRLVLLTINAFRNTGSAQPVLSSVSGGGMTTWTPVRPQDVDTAGTDRATMWVYRAMQPSPGTGTISIAFSGANLSAVSWSVDQSSADVDTGGSNGADAIVAANIVGDTATAAGTTTSVNYAQAVDSANSCFAATGWQGNAGHTPRTNWTELSDVGGGSCGLGTQYRAAPDTAASSTFPNSRWGIVALEIKAASATQTVTPTGIASAEAFGTAAVTRGAVTVSPTGIASAEAFGTATVAPGAVSVAPTGIATAEAFGTPTVASTVTLQPSGIPSAEALGDPTVTTGTVSVTPAGIASGEAFGTAVVAAGGVTVAPTGIPSGEALGTTTVTPGSVTITPTGIASAEAFGTAVVTTAGVTILPTGIASAEAFGTSAIVVGGVVITPTGVASLEAFGSAVVAVGVVLVDVTVVVGPPRLGSVTIGTAESAAVGELRMGSVAIAEPRVGSIAAAAPRAGSLAVDIPRVGSAAAGEPRVGTVTVEQPRTERGP